MTNFLTYLRIKKVEFIHKAVEDFNQDFNIQLPHGSGFTREEFFCQISYNGKNYIHKESYNFMLSNGDTYNPNLRHDSELIINNDLIQVENIKKQNLDIFEFISGEINKISIYPEFLEESKHFYVFKDYLGPEWVPFLKLDKKDAKYIFDSYNNYFKKKEKHISPFLMHIDGEFVKNINTDEIKYKNVKKFQLHPERRLSLYFYNGEINDFYILNRILFFKEKETKYFEADYPISKSRIIYYPSNYLF